MPTFTDESKELVLGPAISMLQVIPGRTTAEVRWTTDKPATSLARVGVISEVCDGSLVTFHSLTLNGLTPGTAYSLTVQSAADGILTTQLRSFATSNTRAPLPYPPEEIVEEPNPAQSVDIIAELQERIRALTLERDKALRHAEEFGKLATMRSADIQAARIGINNAKTILERSQ